jgi:DNA-binding CsgD family transcriptional regulator
MTRTERIVLILVLLFVTISVTIDLIIDSSEGAAISHLLIEGMVGLFALTGILYILRDSFALKHNLKKSIALSKSHELAAEQWRNKTRRLLEGLSESIDAQLTDWHLTPAEKEVAFLLLKGMTSKEIASIRNTAEKTVKVQSTAVYAKSGLSGRSELTAFFLEDLLSPSTRISSEAAQSNPLLSNNA